METIFTPNEAAAFAYLPPKRVYKEIEYKVIQPVEDAPRLSFAALIYLRALKEINYVARYLCEQLLIDAVAVRERGLLGVSEHKILEYAFNEERILVTANIGDFEKFALAFEIHAGIVFIQEGDLLRNEQIESSIS